MLKFFRNWLKIYPDEKGIFLWSILIYFLIRSSNIIFNNFSVTLFLKRFGVEYMPIALMVNSLTTFFIMGFIIGILGRVPGTRLLSYMFMICGLAVTGLRFVIPLGIDLIYPVFFILQMQFESLLSLMFWNLANDLFGMRQSKRLFPLITAGGVLGAIIGSFGTPFLVKIVRLDNLLFVYLGITMAGAFLVRMMGIRYPTLLVSDRKKKKGKARSSMASEFKKVLPMLKESKLIRLLIFMTLLPNVVVPLINYQFNFAVDHFFAYEVRMINFFSIFRGFQGVISLVILFFVSRIYGRWGLPVALMFHPINYMVAFFAFLFNFNIFTAVYARITTYVLRTTINNPAKNVLLGLIPVEYRSVLRPFLRGAVVRVGIFIGSGLIIASEGFLHPRYLSVAGTVFVDMWILTAISLKRSYSGILLDLVSRNMLDLKSMEASELGRIFGDKGIRTRLVDGFLSSSGSECLWYARLLKSLDMPDLDKLIFKVLKDQDDVTRVGLLELLSDRADEEGEKVFRGLADTENPLLLAGLVRAAGCLPPEDHSAFAHDIFESTSDTEVRAHAVSCLFETDPDRYRELIKGWLNSEDVEVRNAGVVAARGSGDWSFMPRLEEMLLEDREGVLVPAILGALRQFSPPGINATVLPYFSHQQESVRLAALDAFTIGDDRELSAVIGLVGDPSEEVHELAKTKILGAEHQNIQLLVKSLGIPRRRLREGLFELLEASDIRDLDVFRFARFHLEKAYSYLAITDALEKLPESPTRDLLIDHMEQRRSLRLENILRVLAAQDRTGDMRIIWRGLSSADARQRSNSLEALEDSLDSALAKILMPLIENLSPSESLGVGKKHFQLPKLDGGEVILLDHLLSKENWVTLVLVLDLIARQGSNGINRRRVTELSVSENPHVSLLAGMVLRRLDSSSPAQKEQEMESEIGVTDRILHLRRIQIFEGLSVNELAAIASVTEESVFEAVTTVFREGDPGDTLYMIVDGEVSIIKEHDDEEGCGEIELARIGSGDYFGEMALFEDVGRSATIRTTRESRVLVLYKREFIEIVREYPEIAIHICKVLSQRIRRQDLKIESYERGAV